jgi:hypothetical protein
MNEPGGAARTVSLVEGGDNTIGRDRAAETLALELVAHRQHLDRSAVGGGVE